MKPLALRLQAFGPFAESQSVDFRRLAESGGLFLIHGQTGSGKTSLIDGLCFALFGSSSGKERDGSGMRSDLADPASPTEAELEFALGADRYRALRRPAQKIKRKRGDGLKQERPDARLERWNAETNNWSLIAAGVDQAGEKIEALLGMGERQFRQVVVLPQGQFRQFLSASSQEREQILETLFRTSEFRALTDSLRERFARLEQEMKSSLHALSGRLASLGADRRERLPEIKALLGERLRIAEARRERALARREAAHAQGQAWSTAKRALAGRARAEADLKILRAGESEAVRLQERRAAHERARPLERPLAERAKDERDRADAYARLAAESERLAEARASARRAESELAEAAAMEPRRLELERSLAELEALAARARRLAAAREAERSALSRAHVAKLSCERSESAAREAEAAANRSADSARKLQLIAARAPGLRAELEALRTRATAIRALLRAADEADDGESAARGAADALALAQRTAEERALDLARARARFFAAQASTLAERLSPGSACPVCGSLEHPAPAANAPPDSSQGAVDAAEREEKAAAAEAARALQEATRARARAEAARERERALRDELAAQSDPPGPSRERLEAALASTIAAGKTKLDESEAANASATLLPEAESAHAAAAELAVRLRTAADATASASASAARAAAEAAAASAALAAELGETATIEQASLEDERRRRSEEADSLRRRLEGARARAAEAGRALASADGVCKELTDRAEALDARLQATDAKLSAAVQDAGFSSVDEACAVLLPAGEAARIETSLLTRAQEMAAAERALALAHEATLAADAEGLDGTVIEAELAAAELEARVAVEEAATAAEAARAFEAQEREIESGFAALAEDEARYAALGRLARVAHGQAPENATGVSLQRFALGAQLDLVLERATNRLLRMTRGQFSLRRVRGRDDARRSAGLDIEVEDAFSGTARPAAYLSGGESFMAALALALGLADVVQEASGGVRIDSVFIDEGFGTLDAEALDLAMRVLADLASAPEGTAPGAGGGRMVGVVSHVPELREQISSRLRVSRGLRGSSAEWAAPLRPARA